MTVRTEGPSGTAPAVRHLRPTDLVALAAFEVRAFPNQARTRDCLDRDRRRPLAITTVLEQWIAAEDRQTLVASSGLGIRGLVSARHRAGRDAWEVDWLVLEQDGEEERAAIALLERLGEEAVKARVQRIFLRLPKESDLAGAASRAGFLQYYSEVLLGRGPNEPPPAHEPAIALRPRQTGDELGLFRLYHGAVPPQVRSKEGMTLEEWCATRDVRFWQQREFVWSEGDRVRGWLQVNQGSGSGQFRLLLLPEDEGHMEDLVIAALARLGRSKRVLVLVPHFQPGLGTLLTQAWGFEPVTEYQNLVRQLAVRVPEARMVPVRA